MTELEFCVPCLFGLEALVGDELKRMDMGNVRVENGRVLFSGTEKDIPRANMRLRTGERILLTVGQFSSESFDELFEGVLALPWEQFIPEGGAFPVKGYALNSKLHSIPDCQRIIKKAVVERLKKKYGGQWLAETGPRYQIQFAIMKDYAALYIDTSGEGLHKRGYRAIGNEAPLRETLAAALVSLMRFRGREELWDPFCGSGTIAIEAAMLALNRAPGLNRKFDAQSWSWLPSTLWDNAAEEARSKEFAGQYRIFGSDIDQASIELAISNSKKAGVSEYITFKQADARSFKSESTGGLIITNPPYGERLMEKSAAERIYADFGNAFRGLEGWKLALLSSHEDFEKHFGAKASKKRKLYNGMIKCNLYMYN